MPYCNNCGHDNPEGSNFCGNCGAVLPGADAVPEGADRKPTGDTTKTIPPVTEAESDGLSAEDEAAVNALPRGSALLIVQRGPNAGSRFLLNHRFGHRGTPPRNPTSFSTTSPSRGATPSFLRTPEGTLVRDSGSLNGTYVNRELVDETLAAAR